MKLLVVGGNGFVGSAVVKSAVQRGWEVVSLSRSGKPFTSAQGHTPAWATKVNWRAGSPFDRASYEDLLPSCTAVVSTLGILLESNYKEGGKASPLGVLRGVVQGVLGDRGNPLGVARERSYERMNRDSALEMFNSFAASSPPSSSTSLARSPFVYISAEDIFRPFVPERYISTKRAAERALTEGSLASMATGATRAIRPIFIRPSLIYHPHINPSTTLPATLLEASARIHSLIPPALRLSNAFAPTPSPLSPSYAGADATPSPHAGAGTRPEQLPSAIASFAGLLSIPPIHVDAVGEAVCKSIEHEHVEGVLDVRGMRAMLGFDPL